MIDKPYAITRTCRVCDGKGVILAPHCLVCGQKLPPDDPWWEEEAQSLPCGHPEMALRMEEACKVCDGNGRVTLSLSEKEWRRFRRRRRLRQAFVVVLSLIFLAVISFVIVREPDLLCGNIWYGIILLVVTARLTHYHPPDWL